MIIGESIKNEFRDYVVLKEIFLDEKFMDFFLDFKSNGDMILEEVLKNIHLAFKDFENNYN